MNVLDLMQLSIKMTSDMMEIYMRTINEFNIPAKKAVEIDKRIRQSDPPTSIEDSISNLFGEGRLATINALTLGKACASNLKELRNYNARRLTDLTEVLLTSLAEGDGQAINKFFRKQAGIVEFIAKKMPKEILAIEPEFGFHFDGNNYKKIDETGRFELYQVLPTEKGISADENQKPVIMVPPYVLGANIMGLLPGEQRSYAHAFANKGIPTFIRIIKDIETTEAVQKMTGDDDAMDTKRFCDKIRDIYDKKVTLNGYCQGGFIALADLLSGKLDDSVDALITCVAPIDGTLSKGISSFLNSMPEKYRSLDYAIKELPNGNNVVDGEVMSWVYKLKSIEDEAPITVMLKTLESYSKENARLGLPKIAAAINFWLFYDRVDLPVNITEMSNQSYQTPIDENGVLPVKLFGENLNLHHLEEKNIPWFLCYGKKDELVEKNTALAAFKHIPEMIEVTEFPGGHGAIAVSYSKSNSPYRLDGRYENGSRGPIDFHLELNKK